MPKQHAGQQVKLSICTLDWITHTTVCPQFFPELMGPQSLSPCGHACRFFIEDHGSLRERSCTAVGTWPTLWLCSSLLNSVKSLAWNHIILGFYNTDLITYNNLISVNWVFALLWSHKTKALRHCSTATFHRTLARNPFLSKKQYIPQLIQKLSFSLLLKSPTILVFKIHGRVKLK